MNEHPGLLSFFQLAYDPRLSWGTGGYFWSGDPIGCDLTAWHDQQINTIARAAQ